jgi:hypothetical protein
MPTSASYIGGSSCLTTNLTPAQLKLAFERREKAVGSMVTKGSTWKLKSHPSESEQHSLKVLEDLYHAYRSCSIMMDKILRWEGTDVETVEKTHHHQTFHKIHDALSEIDPILASQAVKDQAAELNRLTGQTYKRVIQSLIRDNNAAGTEVCRSRAEIFCTTGIDSELGDFSL